MTDVGFLWLSGGLSIVGIAALATAIAIFWRRRSAESPAPVGIVSVPPCAGPIARLSFVQSLDPVRFAEATEEEALAHARAHLRDLIDGTTITLHAWPETSNKIIQKGLAFPRKQSGTVASFGR